ncbi:MAG: Ca-activated chloride channel family protein [Verrucomicrobiales bacterium]|jgi:Ca-activated chloride channel family protein
MKTNPDKQTTPQLSPAEDQLMDSLLREFADRGSEADDAFLAKTEAALDAGEHLTVTSKSDSEPTPTRSRRRLVTPFWFAAGIAAGLAVGLFGSGLFQQEAKRPEIQITEKPNPPAVPKVQIALVEPTLVVEAPLLGPISASYDSDITHRGTGLGVGYANITDPSVGQRLVDQAWLNSDGAPSSDLIYRDLTFLSDVYRDSQYDVKDNIGELNPATAATDFGNIILYGGSTISANGVVNGGSVRMDPADQIIIGGSVSVGGGAGSGGTGVTFSGGDVITVSEAELRAHGNAGAQAIQNTGSIRATGAQSINGRVVLSGGTGADAPALISGRQHPSHGQIAPITVTTVGEFSPVAMPTVSEPKPAVAGSSESVALSFGTSLPDQQGYGEGGKMMLFGQKAESKEELDGRRNAAIAGEGSRDFTETDAALDDPIAGKRDAAPKDRERYGELVDNEFLSPLTAPLSTFSIDVDTASYTNLRRMLNDGAPIPKDAIRIEEMINYFSYNYPQPDGDHPFGIALEAAECPWAPNHQLLRVGIQGETMNREERPASNLVFLLDVSGSMNSSRKLPLVKQSIAMLVEELDVRDTVSIVVYSGAQGLALNATRGDEQKTILDSLDRLNAGGSTNGGAGIKLAYKLARENFVEGGINRVLLCTDGDFNVGTTGQGDLVELVSKKAESGVFLSVLGFGGGNINDSMLEAITNDGNGVYYYIDSQQEARKVFLEEIMGTLVTIAKDVKIQVEFNPSKVQSYRLIGYANRMLEAEDFADDTVDAGEIGAGHQVTALYEIVPADVEMDEVAKPREAPELEFQRVAPALIPSEKLAVLKLRYKQPDGDVSTLIRESVENVEREWQHTSDDFQFASSLALFGMLLRDSEYTSDGTFAEALELATEGTGVDPHGRRAEFQQLLRKAMERFARGGRGAAVKDDDDVYGGASISVSF